MRLISKAVVMTMVSAGCFAVLAMGPGAAAVKDAMTAIDDPYAEKNEAQVVGVYERLAQLENPKSQEAIEAYRWLDDAAKQKLGSPNWEGAMAEASRLALSAEIEEEILRRKQKQQ